jgi:hypothetical protein
MHPEVTGKKVQNVRMWYGTNRESGARYSNGKEDANNADEETKMQCQTLKQLRQLRLQLMKVSSYLKLKCTCKDDSKELQTQGKVYTRY